MPTLSMRENVVASISKFFEGFIISRKCCGACVVVLPRINDISFHFYFYLGLNDSKQFRDVLRSWYEFRTFARFELQPTFEVHDKVHQPYGFHKQMNHKIS